MQEVLEYLFKRLKAERPVTHEVDGQVYAIKNDGTLGEPVRALAPQWDEPTFSVATLGALAALYKGAVDGFDASTVGLHVSDYRSVKLIKLKADGFGRRHLYASAAHVEETPFKFNEFLPAEKFMIDFRASFYFNDEAVKVVTVVSSLESGHAVSVADDGLSQKLEIKAGTTSKTPVVLPADGVPLIAWRTFREAAPVESKFLLRLKTIKDSLPTIALFEIDQKWKLDTVNSIADWLRTNVEGATMIA